MRRSIALAGAAVLVGGILVSAPPAHATPDRGSDLSRVLQQHGDAVRAAEGDEYAVHHTTTDPDGATHTRYTRTYRGLRVHGGDIIVHADAAGRFTGAATGLSAPLSPPTTPRVTADRAARTAEARFSGTISSVGTPELVIEASLGRGTLAWETVVRGLAPDGQTPSALHVISDATSGTVIRSFDEIRPAVRGTVTTGAGTLTAGTGNGIYSGTVPIDTTPSGPGYVMIDPSHGGGNTCDMFNGTSTCTNFTDADNTWGSGTNSDRQSAGVDAHFGAAATYDYYKNIHGRNGIFGTGAGVTSRVHYGSNFTNAYWDGAAMTYGDGAGNARPLVSLDMAGHEMSRQVVQSLVPLTYSGESGALYEASLDIFASMIEFYAGAPGDTGDYVIFEKLDLNGNGTPWRYLYDPPLDGASHGCWSSTTKDVDARYASGVANHFFFNLAEGTGTTAYGTSPLCGPAPAMTGIGRTKAEKIWYRALALYFTATTSYVNTANPGNTARASTLAAATDLFGQCSTEYRAVQAAWTAVNVTGADAACPSDFALAASPATGPVNAGDSVTTTVSSTLISGSPQLVALSVSGLPPGAAATFYPTAIGSADGSSTLTIVTSVGTPTGSYPLTITGIGTVTRTTEYTLTVNAPATCSGTNPTDTVISDSTTVSSAITLDRCPGGGDGDPAPHNSVDVHLTHSAIGDLVLSLVAPDGSVYLLQDREGGSASNIDTEYGVDLSSEPSADGTWKLRVRDAATGDIGVLDSWSVHLADRPGCTRINDDDVNILDNGTVESSIVVTGCSGSSPEPVPGYQVDVHVAHPNIGDLVISVVAPDGTVYPLHNRAGGSTDDINSGYTVNLLAEPFDGTWKLRVQDAAALNTGSLDSWTLHLGHGPGCHRVNDDDWTIIDSGTVESPITISGCTPYGSAGSTVDVHLDHTYIGDLVLTLEAPDGSLYPLHTRSGGGTDDIDVTYTVDLSAEPANGTWRLRITDAAALDTGYLDSWTLDVGTVSACTRVNPASQGVPDPGAATSTIGVTDCAGTSTGSTVDVHLTHPRISDLVVSLIAPDGTAYPLHNRSGGHPGGINTGYTVALATEPANGTWRLRITDAVAAQTGYLDTWTLHLGSAAACKVTNRGDVAITDSTTVESSITVSGCAGNASAVSTVEVHVAHPNIGDLVITLIAPDGTTYTLHNRTGGTLNNIDTVYTVNLSAEAANGTWSLRVEDAVATNVGDLHGWSLTL